MLSHITGSEIAFAICFYAAAAVAVASAVMVVWHKNPVISALFLAVCLFAVAVNYVFLQAHFLAAVQVLLYAGAVLVLFIMVIMLINQSEKELKKSRPTLGKAIGIAAVFGVVLIMVTVVAGYRVKLEKGRASPQELAAFLVSLGAKPSEFITSLPPGQLTDQEKMLVAKSALESLDDPETRAYAQWPPEFALLTRMKIDGLRKGLVDKVDQWHALSEIEAPIGYTEFKREDMVIFIATGARARLRQLEEFGTTAAVGRMMFSQYLLPFEAASILLLGAIVGVLVLARRYPEGGS